MKLPHRREFLHLATGAAALPVVSRTAWADTYPTRPVRLTVGAAAGAAPDIVARIAGQWLSEHFGQGFVIDNRPGAGTNIATEAVVRAAPDGYSLLFVTAANSINATLYDNLKFDFIRDITPVAGIARIPFVLVVNPSFPARTFPELIAYAKANPGKLSMASDGNGTVSHVAGELLKLMTGIDTLHVPYRSGPPALTDLMGGQVQVMFEPVVSAIAFIKAGKLRPLAVSSATRLDLLPDVPAVADFVPGFEATGPFGLGAPKGTPTAIVDRLNQEINRAAADPKTVARFAELGGLPMPMTPAEFRKLIVDETEKWAKVVKFSGAKPD
jgi:tripartite-type tricarboxylate transporter receptor subunit TctC